MGLGDILGSGKNHRLWKTRSASRRPSWLFPKYWNDMQYVVICLIPYQVSWKSTERLWRYPGIRKKITDSENLEVLAGGHLGFFHDSEIMCSMPSHISNTISSFMEIHWKVLEISWDPEKNNRFWKLEVLAGSHLGLFHKTIMMCSMPSHRSNTISSFMEIDWKVMEISWDPEKNHRFWPTQSASRRPSWIFPQFRNDVQYAST